MREPRERLRRTVRMPDVVGLTLENARLLLGNAGFDPGRVDVRYEEAYRREDEAIRQSPEPGSLVAVDSPVELVVARRSLLHHLPQVFQKADARGGHFLREFLWIFDHVFADLQRHIDRLHRYFDPLETPAEFLPWLASWVALAIEQDWPEPKQRRLIQQAMSIYACRGTVRGLKMFLSIFTDVEPLLRENEWPFRGFRIGEVRIGVDSLVIPPVNPAHCFIVEVPARFTDTSDETLHKLHRIIRMEKPSHTAYYLVFAAEPADPDLRGFQIGLGAVGLEVDGVVAGAAVPEDPEP